MTGLCTGLALTGQDWWTSDDPAEREAAKLICDRCPVAADCLRGALARGEKWGVWAGMWLGPAEIEMASPDEPQGHVRVAVYAPAHGSRAAYMRCTDGDDGQACQECCSANSAYVAQHRREEQWTPNRKPKRRKKREGQVSLLDLGPVTTSETVMA